MTPSRRGVATQPATAGNVFLNDTAERWQGRGSDRDARALPLGRRSWCNTGEAGAVAQSQACVAPRPGRSAEANGSVPGGPAGAAKPRSRLRFT